MPYAPPRACNRPRCPNLATTRGYCDDHQPPAWAGRDDKRARYDGISSGEWRALKARVSHRDHGCCYMCGAEPDPDTTFVLDHKVPMAEGGSPRDLENLGLLCPGCDAVKSAAEAERGRQRWQQAQHHNREHHT